MIVMLRSVTLFIVYWLNIFLHDETRRLRSSKRIRHGEFANLFVIDLPRCGMIINIDSKRKLKNARCILTKKVQLPFKEMNQLWFTNSDKREKTANIIARVETNDYSLMIRNKERKHSRQYRQTNWTKKQRTNQRAMIILQHKVFLVRGYKFCMMWFW